jgi:hypothetical protein
MRFWAMPQHPLQISHLLFKKQGSSQVLGVLIPVSDGQIGVVDRQIAANLMENDAYDP